MKIKNENLKRSVLGAVITAAGLGAAALAISGCESELSENRMPNFREKLDPDEQRSLNQLLRKATDVKERVHRNEVVDELGSYSIEAGELSEKTALIKKRADNAENRFNSAQSATQHIADEIREINEKLANLETQSTEQTVEIRGLLDKENGTGQIWTLRKNAQELGLSIVAAKDTINQQSKETNDIKGHIAKLSAGVELEKRAIEERKRKKAESSSGPVFRDHGRIR